MEQKNITSEKENTLLHTDVSSVFVVQNSRRRPFIEQFEHASVNFTQKELGMILGFFIVRDESSTSENIVNFLASEVKKQYFAPTERSVEEKFESTLHRVNRALEEIANIGNVEWLGTIEGAVCVIDDTSIHFSITGNAHILLLRNNTLIDISEGLASEEAANYPLKTFVDISSGDMCPHDKIIITSHELLDLIPLEELQKNAIRMGEKNFIQFIETALTNECAIASATIIDISLAEQKQPMTKPHITRETPDNFFGANAFEKEPVAQPRSQTKEEIDVEELVKEQPKEYTDPRTGHIHIQGDSELPEGPTILETVFEKMTDALDTTRSATNKKTRLLTKKISALGRSDTTKTQNNTFYEQDDLKETSPSMFTNILALVKVLAHRMYSGLIHVAKMFFVFCTDMITMLKEKILTKLAERKNMKSVQQYASESSHTQQKKTFFPHIGKIRSLWNTMSTSTKIGAFGMIAFILLVPLLFSFFSRDRAEDKDQQPEEEITEDVAMENTEDERTFQNTVTDPTVISESPDTASVTVLEDIVLGIEANSIRIIDDGTTTTHSLPDNAGSIVYSAAMSDLNMLFILTDAGNLYSFSPTVQKFTAQENIPELDPARISAFGAYSTYLYTIDDESLLRYARQENGFKEGETWLNDTFDFTGTTSIAINDEIFITQDSDVIKFANHKKQRYTKDDAIENASFVFSAEGQSFVWILDREHATVYKTDKEQGTVIDTFVHTALTDAQTIAVNEDKELLFAATQEKIMQFSIAQ
jgi:hypothetical protein